MFVKRQYIVEGHASRNGGWRVQVSPQSSQRRSLTVMPQLKPVCFGSRRCKGFETRLHSYLGEGFTGDWGLSKCTHYLWGLRNTWITDQYALVFLLTYDGDNAPVRRLQMRIMNYFVDIVHRNARFLAPADYGSRHGGDMWWDPLIASHNA